MADENTNTGIQFEDIVPWENETGDTGLTARLKLKRNFDKIKTWMDDNGLAVDMVREMIEETSVTKDFFNAIFRLEDADGNAITPNNATTAKDRLKILVGTYTDQYLSALGLGTDGSGGAGDVTWDLLADSNDTRPIALSHLTTALSTYATQSWVQSQGYATIATVNAWEFLNNVTSGGNGLVTLSTNKGNSFVLDLTHQHSWFEIQDRPTTIAGFGITDASISNGVITIGANTITPVTQVAMTMPTGFSVSGSPVTKTGTLAVTYATGYEGFTTALKQKIEALFSWFEVDADGNVKTKDWDDNGTSKHRGFYSPSFISALGQGDDGSAGSGDVTWELLADSNDTRQIASSHLSTALAGYATQQWVTSQGYLTQHQSLANYYTKDETDTAISTAINVLEYLNNVTSGGNGLVTLSTNKGNSFVLDLTHQHSWFEILDRPTTIAGFGIVMTADDIPALDWSKIATGKPTTLAGYGITDASISDGVITLGSSTITPITSVNMTVPTGFNVSGVPISKTGTIALTYTTGYEGFTTALKQKIEALYSWFEIDSNGNVKTKDWDDNGTTKHRGFYSPSFISALGLSDDGGSGGVGDVTWELLRDSSDYRQIAISHLTGALTGYATQGWVTSQNYATLSDLNALEFLNNVISTDGSVTFITNKTKEFIVDLTHSHSWFELIDRPSTITGLGVVLSASDIPNLDWSKITTGKPTTLAGYGIIDAKIENGVITLGSSVITPVTSVAMTVPTGLSVTGSPITKTGTFAVSYASGYEGFTTSLKQKIEALFSWFEVDSDGNIKTKDYTENNVTKHRGFYSPSFVSALGLSDDGSTGGIGDVTWDLLNDPTDNRQINSSHLTTALAAYATQSWVNTILSSYYTANETDLAISSAIGLLEYVNNVIGSDGYITLKTNKNNSFVIDFTHNHSWFDIQDKPTTLIGMGLDIQALTILGDGNSVGAYTPSSAMSVNFVSGTNISISRDATNHKLTINNTYNHPTGGANVTIQNANGRVLSAITVNEYGHVSSVGYKTLSMSDMPSVMKYYNSITLSEDGGTLTFGGYNISDSIVDLTHQHSWFEIQDKPTTLAGYGISKDDPLLNENYITIEFFERLFKAYNGASQVHPNSTATIDNIKAMFGFWTQQYISALGQNSDGQSGSGDVTWALLADNTDTRQIALSHLTNALSSYATQGWVSSQGFATQAWVNQQSYATQATVNALEFLNNVISSDSQITLSTNKGTSYIIDFSHKHNWFELLDRPDTIAGLGVLNDLNSILSVYATQSWVSSNFNNYVHPTNGANTTITNANGRVLSAITVNNLGHVTSVGYKALSMSDMPSAMMYYNNIILNTDGSIKLSGYNISDSILDFSHSHSWFDLQDRPDTLKGLNISSSDDVLKNNYLALTGGTITGTVTMNANLYMTGYTLVLESGYSWSDIDRGIPFSTTSGINNIRYVSSDFTYNPSKKVLNAGNVICIGNNPEISVGTNSSKLSLHWAGAGNIRGLYDSSNIWVISYTSGGTYMHEGVGIGIATPSTALHVIGDIYATGGVTSLSDKRKKDIIGNLNLDINQIAEAPAIRFLWKDKRDAGTQAGTIAQYWQNVLPEVVFERNAELSMQYGVAALIASITTAKKVVDHERRISELESENIRLRKEIVTMFAGENTKQPIGDSP